MGRTFDNGLDAVLRKPPLGLPMLKCKPDKTEYRIVDVWCGLYLARNLMFTLIRLTLMYI